MIMERASVAAIARPSVATVKPREAKAMEGAAPNNPPNVFGLNKSETTENADTTEPPMRNRIRISITFPLPSLCARRAHLIDSKPQQQTLDAVSPAQANVRNPL